MASNVHCMKSLGCPKQPYVLWEAQGSELPLSAMEHLTGFVLSGTALLPPCPAWEGRLEQIPPRTPRHGHPMMAGEQGGG